MSFIHVIVVVAAIVSAALDARPTRAQPDRSYGHPSFPVQTTMNFTRQRYRLDRLPPDVRTAVSAYPNLFGPAIANSRERGWRLAIFSFVRLTAPRRQRQFLFIHVSDGINCGSAGCDTFGFERIDNRWIWIQTLDLKNSFSVLPYWNDGYPAIVSQTNDAFITMHWWENGGYMYVCFPPTEQECQVYNNEGFPDIFRGRVAPREE